MDRLKISPSSVDSGSATASPHFNSLKMDPPIQRFLETQDARDLRVGDVAALLEDYKRLAGLLHKSGAGSR